MARVFGKTATVPGETFDAATGAQVPITDATTGTSGLTYPISARGVSPEHGGAVYFTTAGSVLVRYDLATRTITRLNAVVSRGAAIAYGWVGDVLYGLAGNYSGGTFSFDTTTGVRPSGRRRSSTFPRR